MSSSLFSLDPNMGLAYAKYKAQKEESSEKVDFADFFLDYVNSQEEKNRKEWLEALFGVDADTSDLSNSALASVQNGSLLGFEEYRQEENEIDYFSSIDSQVDSLRLKLLEAFKKRYEETETNEAAKAAKIASLYAEAEAVKTPARFAGFLV